MAEDRIRWTRDELLAEARARFGEDPKLWAFVCPSCGDVATPADFLANDADPNLIGQECIGRSFGALRGEKRTTKQGVTVGDAPRGCDWCAYGLFRGPWLITFPDGKEVGSFRLAPAEVPA